MSDSERCRLWRPCGACERKIRGFLLIVGPGEIGPYAERSTAAACKLSLMAATRSLGRSLNGSTTEPRLGAECVG